MLGGGVSCFLQLVVMMSARVAMTTDVVFRSCNFFIIVVVMGVLRILTNLHILNVLKGLFSSKKSDSIH